MLALFEVREDTGDDLEPSRMSLPTPRSRRIRNYSFEHDTLGAVDNYDARPLYAGLFAAGELPYSNQCFRIG